MKQANLVLAIVFAVAFATIGAAQVSIVSPRDGELIRSRWINLKVVKPSPGGYVMIWFDGKFMTAITSPFEFRIDLSDLKILSGTHTIRVVGFNDSRQKEGEAQVQFQVQLIGEEVENLRLIFKTRTGELNFYTFQASSEASVEIPAKAIRRKVPHLGTKLTLRWFQTVRDVTVDKQFKIMRVIEEGTLEREAPIAFSGASMMGGGGAPMLGPSGQPGMFGGMPGEETSYGASTPMGAPPTGMMAQAFGPLKLRIRPTDDQKVGIFVLFPSGEIASSEEMPNVVKFATNSVDISLPEEVLKTGKSWLGSLILPRNLENLTIVGGPQATPTMGGLSGSEEYPGMAGGLGMIGGPGMVGGTGIGRPGMGGPMMPRQPGMPGAQPGAPPTAPGVIQEAEAFLADAPIVEVRAVHRLDGFEYWNNKLCARIVSEFTGVTVELNLAPTTGTGTGAMGGMFGTPGAVGSPMMPGSPMRGGEPTGSPMSSGAPPTSPGQFTQPQPMLKGTAEGTRTLLFEIEGGQVVYAKVTMKATFNTDFLTVMPFIQLQQQLAGAPGGAPGGTSPTSGLPGSPTTPFGSIGSSRGLGGTGGTPFLGTPWGGGFYTGSPLGGTPFGGTPFGGGAYGFGGAPFGGTPFGGTPFGGGAYGFGGAPFGGTPFGEMPSGFPFGGTPPGGAGAPSTTQVTFRNHPAKLTYMVKIENTLTYSGRLDQQLNELFGAR